MVQRYAGFFFSPTVKCGIIAGFIIDGKNGKNNTKTGKYWNIGISLMKKQSTDIII